LAPDLGESLEALMIGLRISVFESESAVADAHGSEPDVRGAGTGIATTCWPARLTPNRTSDRLEASRSP